MAAIIYYQINSLIHTVPFEFCAVHTEVSNRDISKESK